MSVVGSALIEFPKPLAEITDFNRPFFAALREHQFLVPRCRTCGDYSWIPYPACRSCQSLDLNWTPVSGEATLYTFSVVHRGPGVFGADVPYVVAMGELVEQPRPCLVIANLIGTAPDTLHIGQQLRMAYEDRPGEHSTGYHWVSAPS